MIYFLIYLFAEVYFTIEIAAHIGGLTTFLEIIVSALIGIFLLKNLRHSLVENIALLQMHQIDLKQFSQRNMWGIAGAILLILPGFVGDLIGALFQLALFNSLLINRFGRKYTSQTSKTNTTTKDEHVIDAEIIDHTTALR